MAYNLERHRASQKKWNDANPERRKETQRRYDKRRVASGTAFLAWLKDGPCTDCSRSYPTECMDFDHARDKKACDVSSMKNRTWRAIFDEVEKCDLVCANCHRIRTRKRAA